MPIQPLSPEITGQLKYIASVLKLVPGHTPGEVLRDLKSSFRSGGDTAVRAYLERYHRKLLELEIKTTPAL